MLLLVAAARVALCQRARSRLRSSSSRVLAQEQLRWALARPSSLRVQIELAMLRSLRVQLKLGLLRSLRVQLALALLRSLELGARVRSP